MSDLRRTIVTLEVSIPQLPLQIDIDRKVSELLSCKGVESIEIEPFPQWLRLNLNVTITGVDSKQLQRCYNKISRVADQPPFVLSGRKCSLTEMFSDQKS